MNPLMELMVLGQLGVVLHYWKQYAEASKDDKVYNLSKSIPTAILSSLTTGILIYLHKDIEDLYVVTRFSAVILGYFGNSIFFSFVDAKKPKV